MNATRIERHGVRRNRRMAYSCGCLSLFALLGVTLLVLGYLFLPVVVNVVLQIAGYERIGDTGDLFADVTPPPTAIVQNPGSPPQQITVNLGQYGQETLNTDPQSYTIVAGNTDTGASVARATFTEAGLMDLCRQRSALCRDEDDRFRNVSIDLRPGGVVIYADVSAGGPISQRVGVVLRLDSTRMGFDVAGVDVNGTLYNYESLPGEIVTAVRDIERVGNDILRQVVVDTGGERYTLSDVVIDETTLTLILG